MIKISSDQERTAFETRYIVLLLSYLLGSTTLTIIAPIMPYQMKEKGIPTQVNAFVFWAFSFAGLIASIYCSKYLPILGPKHFVFGGLIGLTVAHLIYALLSLIANHTVFTIVIVSNRLLEGWSFGLIQGVVYGASSQELPPLQFDRFARTWSASWGIGGWIALLSGAFLFSVGGYFLPYFILSGSLILLTFIIYISGSLEDEVKQYSDSDVELISFQIDSEESTPEHQILDLNFVFKIKEARIGLMSIILSNIVLTFLDPIFALKMLELNIYADKAGYIYVFLLGSYSFFGLLGGTLEKIWSKKALIIYGYLFGVLGFCSLAHKLFLWSNFLMLVIFGLFLNGFSVIGGNMFATMYTKAKLLSECEKVGISKNVAGGYFGGLKGSCNLIGYFIGPLISPNFYILVGFDYSWLLMGSMQLLFVIYFWMKSLN